VQASGNSRLLEHFEAIDTNKDGKITPEEIRAMWQRREAPPPAR
jgi:Ca2+-binding EF-hand superfamily protein